jgi:hypothetical protein
MLKIINGKRYNTETATDVLSLDINAGMYVVESRSDFRWEDTELYLTKKGEWFLAGQGNALSRWGRQCGSMRGPGSGIMPICSEEAQAILEEHGQTELIEKYFSDKISDA